MQTNLERCSVAHKLINFDSEGDRDKMERKEGESQRDEQGGGSW